VTEKRGLGAGGEVLKMEKCTYIFTSKCGKIISALGQGRRWLGNYCGWGGQGNDTTTVPAAGEVK